MLGTSAKHWSDVYADRLHGVLQDGPLAYWGLTLPGTTLPQTATIDTGAVAVDNGVTVSVVDVGGDVLIDPQAPGYTGTQYLYIDTAGGLSNGEDIPTGCLPLYQLDCIGGEIDEVSDLRTPYRVGALPS
jgi:hypothetical protein